MTSPLLAQAMHGWSFTQMAIVMVAIKYFGVALPSFVVTIFWIVVCACVAIMAIRFVAGM